MDELTFQCVLLQNSAKRQTPYSAVSDGTNETPQTDIFKKEYEGKNNRYIFSGSV